MGGGHGPSLSPAMCICARLTLGPGSGPLQSLANTAWPPVLSPLLRSRGQEPPPSFPAVGRAGTL